MNPFERLRKAIDNVNVQYEFAQDQNQPELKSTSNKESSPLRQQNIVSITNNDEVQRIKEAWEKQQLVNVREMTELTAKIEQLQKNLKRSETVIQNQMNQIVELEQQNQQLKANLNQQYASVVQYDEKERKYKEQIYRINITINELAVQIQAQRNSKKQLSKELEALRCKIKSQEQQFAVNKEIWEKQRLKLMSELEQRIEMFEYHVKKSSQDRRQYKLTLSASQENYSRSLDTCRQEINSLKNQLSESKKCLQIQTIRKKNCEQALQRQRAELQRLKSANLKLQEQIQNIKQKFQESQKREQALEKNLSSLGSQLAEQKKNQKIKVIQVRDETLNLELQMYKRQCKQLLQQKLIMKSLMNYPTDKAFEPDFKLVESQQSNSV